MSIEQRDAWGFVLTEPSLVVAQVQEVDLSWDIGRTAADGKSKTERINKVWCLRISPYLTSWFGLPLGLQRYTTHTGARYNCAMSSWLLRWRDQKVDQRPWLHPNGQRSHWTRRSAWAWWKIRCPGTPRYLSIYLSLSLSIYLSIYLSTYLSIYLSIYLSSYIQLNFQNMLSPFWVAACALLCPELLPIWTILCFNFISASFMATETAAFAATRLAARSCAPSAKTA